MWPINEICRATVSLIHEHFMCVHYHKVHYLAATRETFVHCMFYSVVFWVSRKISDYKLRMYAGWRIQPCLCWTPITPAITSTIFRQVTAISGIHKLKYRSFFIQNTLSDVISP